MARLIYFVEFVLCEIESRIFEFCKKLYEPFLFSTGIVLQCFDVAFADNQLPRNVGRSSENNAVFLLLGYR